MKAFIITLLVMLAPLCHSMSDKQQKKLANKKFCLALKQSDKQTVETMIDEGFEPTSLNTISVSPMQLVTDLAIGQMLLGAGCKGSDATSWSNPLTIAATYGDEQMVKFLLDNNAQVSDARNIFRYAAQTTPEVVKLLLANNKDPLELNTRYNNDKKDPLDHASDPKIMQLLINANAFVDIKYTNREHPYYNFCRLYRVVHKGKLLKVQTLLACNAQLEHYWHIPIETATHVSPEMVATLLHYKADPNKYDNIHTPSLVHITATQIKNDREAIVKLLVGAKASLGYTTRNYIRHNFSKKEAQEIEEIADNGTTTIPDLPVIAADNPTLLKNKLREQTRQLVLAIRQSNATQVKQLLKQKADPCREYKVTSRYPLQYACTTEIAQLLIDAQADPNIGNYALPLHKAIEEENEPLVKALLQNNADVNKQDQGGQYPLHRAAQSTRTIARLIRKAGADPMLKNSDDQTAFECVTTKKIARQIMWCKGFEINAIQKYGRTLLIGKVDGQQWSLAALLIRHQAAINQKESEDNQQTPLHAAIKMLCKPKAKKIAYLLKYNADPNIKDKNGNTACHDTACLVLNQETNKDLLSVMKLLIEYGGDFSIKNNTGETTQSILLQPPPAAKNRADEILKFCETVEKKGKRAKGASNDN